MELSFIQVLLLVLLGIFSVPLLFYLYYWYYFRQLQPRLLYSRFGDIEIKSGKKNVIHQEITYITRDGEAISAWFVPFKDNIPEPDDEEDPKPKESNGTVLFCHGNAGNISQRIDSFHLFHALGLDVFIFDYRGYGQSTGTPSEKGTYLDADGAWECLTRKLKVKPEEIILFGRSLGGAVASYLAQTYHPRGLILESTFTSIPELVPSVLRFTYFKLPIRYNYNTRKRLKKIHCPVLVIHSPDDQIIPYFHGQALFEAANEPKQFMRIKGEHTYGYLKSKWFYLEGLKDFLGQLPPIDQRPVRKR